MRTLNWGETGVIFGFSILFCSNILLGNMGLQFISVSLVQVVRSMIPALTMALSIVILGKKYSNRLYFYSVLLVISGVSLASFGEIDFHMGGFLLIVLVCILSSLKSVVTSWLMVGSFKFHPFDLLFRMSSFGSLCLLIFVTLSSEQESFSLWWEDRGSWSMFFALLINGLMAFALNFANFVTTQKTSALTITIAGNLKHVLTIMLSVIIFQNPLTPLNVLGTIITVIGAAVYSYVDYTEKAKK